MFLRIFSLHPSAVIHDPKWMNNWPHVVVTPRIQFNLYGNVFINHARPFRNPN